jgi:hypothetical protein
MVFNFRLEKILDNDQGDPKNAAKLLSFNKRNQKWNMKMIIPTTFPKVSTESVIHSVEKPFASFGPKILHFQSGLCDGRSNTLGLRIKEQYSFVDFVYKFERRRLQKRERRICKSKILNLNYLTQALFTRDILAHNIAIKRYCNKKLKRHFFVKIL